MADFVTILRHQADARFVCSQRDLRASVIIGDNIVECITINRISMRVRRLVITAANPLPALVARIPALLGVRCARMALAPLTHIAPARGPSRRSWASGPPPWAGATSQAAQR
jgi:hypothetical protein